MLASATHLGHGAQFFRVPSLEEGDNDRSKLMNVFQTFGGVRGWHELTDHRRGVEDGFLTIKQDIII